MRCCFALFCFLLCLSIGARTAKAQETPLLPPPSSLLPPLFWADGITQASELDAYKAQGLNVVVVRLSWTAAPNGEMSSRDLAPQRAFAEEAARRDLKIIYALPAAPTGLASEFRMSAGSGAYVSLWTTWLQGAVAALRDTPNLLGWMLPDDPRALPFFDDADFHLWLNQNYADVEVLNRQWKTNYGSFDEIPLADVTRRIADWNRPPALTQDKKGGVSEARPPDSRGWTFHPAALALAHYKWDAYRALLTTWVGALRGEDSAHLVFSGRTPDYAQLLALPAGIDIAVPDIAPDAAEADLVTHNPQAIDIARRGGKFGVWPVLSPRVGAQLPASALPDLTRRWINEACARGAWGVGFDSWQNLRAVPGLSQAVSEEIEKLSKPAYASIWGEAPINSSALILAPLADGATLNFGLPPQQVRRGVYGFGEDLVEGEPSGLVWMLRWGTAFGGVDYLAPDDLNETPLERYRTIVAPQLLSVDAENTTQLTRYVAGGGVLIADLGLGAMQNGGKVDALPAPLATLFGVRGAFEMRSFPFNLAGVAPHPLFPAWSSLIRARPGMMLTAGDGPDGAAFTGPVGLSPATPQTATSQTATVATSPRIGETYGAVNRVLSAPLTINALGRGYAVFAPFRLWTSWRPGQAGFDNFLGDAMRRDATVLLPMATSLVPMPVTATLGQTLFPEVTNRAGSVTLANHSAPGSEAQMATVQTASAGDWLWSNALVHFPLKADFPIVGMRRAPIDNPDNSQSRPRPISLYASLLPGEMRALSLRPIAAQNLSGGPLAAQINEESARRLNLNLWPNSPAIFANGAQWSAALAAPAQVRVTVVSSPSGYLCAPGTRHRVQILGYDKTKFKNRYPTVTQTVIADARGRLSFEFSGIMCDVEVTPIS